MAVRKKKSGKKKSAGPRASWKGNVAFGLVSFPAQAWNAVNKQEGDIHFHQLHEACHSRIRHKKVCPTHGEVTSNEIISGYEYKKGKYVEIEPEELAALRTPSERALSIDAFVEPDAVDPLYFDGRMYYLLPDGPAADEAYAVMVQAMEREGYYGIGQMVFSGKEQLVLVRPLEGVLHLAMLNYDEEIRPPEAVALSHVPRNISRKVQLAQTLIRSWSRRDFDFTEYDDPYRQRVQELIEAKVEGREIVAPQEEEPAEVINLMDALKKSLARQPSRRAQSRGRRRRA
jgi:DNA end-binding protein Ku